MASYTLRTQVSKNESDNLKQNNKYHRLLENLNMGVLEVDLEHKIQFANDVFCRMTGYQESELIGKVAKDTFLQKVENQAQDIFEENWKIRKMGGFSAYNIKLQTKDGNQNSCDD